MRYATWTISQPEGTTPEPLIRSRGGQASGGIMLDANTVLGYVWNDVDLTGLDKWNLTEKTQTESLALAQSVNAECFLADDGTIQTPPPYIN